MKAIILFLFVSLTTNAGLHNVFDGSGATCSSQYDVFNSKRSGVFRFTTPIIKRVGSKYQVLVEVAFLECKKTKKGYKFFKKNDYKYSLYEMNNGYGPFTVIRHDKRRDVLATNDLNELVAESGIIKIGRKHFAKLTFSIEDMSVNDFENAQEKGEYYIDLSMRSLRSYYTVDELPEYSYVGSGMYRLFLSPSKLKAQF